MSVALQSTLTLLQSASAAHSRALVAFSGGKDSLVTLDLALRSFKECVCFYAYFVPGLRHIEESLQYARERYGVTILQVPHWNLAQCLSRGIYCDNSPALGGLTGLGWGHVYDGLRAKTGIPLILTGAKRTDSRWRKLNLSKAAANEGLLHPLKDWNKFDVLAYLKQHDLPMPASEGTNASGVDLTTCHLLWLHDKYPDDFQLLLKWFPYAEAVIRRREYYGPQKKDAGSSRGR